tara:strand:- start:518 stop:1039 length:522 start_codon:yes stop_codon:yes gene_type:complete
MPIDPVRAEDVPSYLDIPGLVPTPEPEPEPAQVPLALRPYTILPAVSADEAALLKLSGLDPADYVPAMCPAVAPPQPAQPVQPVTLQDPQTGERLSAGMVILVPIVVPIAPPPIVSGVVGPSGARTSMAGPPGASVRILLPRESMTAEALAEHAQAVSSLDGDDGETASPDAS